MVKTRFATDSESKMPVKNTPKEEPREELDSACMSEKDNSDYSSKTPKVWSRELRNRFVISSEKRSIRFTNNVVRSERGLRSCRMALNSRQHFSLSQSDDDDEDERMFSPRSSSKRLKHRLGKRRMRANAMAVENSNVKQDSPPHRHHYPRRRQINGLIGKSEGEHSNHDLSVNGIRRSTRQRKLKYDNYSDSWIVGAQTLVGYPMYGNSYSSKGKRDPALMPSLKEEVEEEEEEEEEEDDDEDEEDDEKGGDETEEGETEAEGEEPKNVPSRSRGVKVENSKQSSVTDTSFQDMYSRVKRPRPTRRTLYQVQTRQAGGRKSVDHTSSSDESSSEERVARGRKRDMRVEARKYHLRETKPMVKRFVPEVAESRSRALREAYRGSVRRRPRRRRRSSSSSSSSTSSDNTATHFDRKKPKARSRCLTSVGQEGVAGRNSNGVRPSGVGRLADVDPVSLDTSIRFSDVGGLEEHVKCLQEMVVFPMLYSEVFSKFHITPPKGVLFHGPPGTGKTLIARALANECSQGDRKVSFFMRKGADCLCKWVGESERQLRLLFEQAHQSKPSIIFFDEIDGLAPVRSAKQDQIHASIVSTLLALMDGLDNRGDIIVIGATNRIDAIDPALRRPGRFDRELLFPLPANKERKEILRIHVSKWEKPPTVPLLNYLAESSVGFCGSDLRALCSEAVIHALRRKYPQIYKSSQKLLLDPDSVLVEKVDFEGARKGIIPSSYRSAPAVARKLPAFLQPVLNRDLNQLTSHLQNAFPSGFHKFSKNIQVVKSPRLLIIGQQKQTTLLSAALLYLMEQCPIHTLDLSTLFCQSSQSPEEACIQIFNEVRRSIPSILFLPGIGEWWDTVGNTVQAVFTSLLYQLDPFLPVLFLATSRSSLPTQLQYMFSHYRSEIYLVQPANEKERTAFFKPLILERAVQPPRPLKRKVPLPELPLAPPPEPPKLTETQLQSIYSKEENTLRELRIFLRQICSKLARNRQFYMFSKPVDVNEVPDYLSIIKEPMDLETMMTKIDLHKYICAQDFLSDIDLLVCNALEYNPDRNPADKLIRHRACYLRDTAYALIKAEMDSDFEEQCKSIRASRSGRAASPDRFVPDFVWTASNLPPNMSSTPNLGSSIDGSAQQIAAMDHSNDISNSSYPRSHSLTASNHESLMCNSNSNHSYGHSLSMDHNRMIRKRRHKNLWQRGLIRQLKKPQLNNSSSEISMVRERNKTDISTASTSLNTRRLLNNTRSSSSASCDKQQSMSNNSHSIDSNIDSLCNLSQPLKRRRRDDSGKTTSPVSPGGNDQASTNSITEQEQDNKMDEIEIDGIITSDEEDEGEEMMNASCRSNELDDSFNTSTVDNNDTSPKHNKSKSNTTNSSINNKKQVIINRNALQKLLQEIVRATDSVTSLEMLLDLYAQLRSVINKHMRSCNRTSLPSQLEAELKRFIVQQQHHTYYIGEEKSSSTDVDASPRHDNSYSLHS